MDKKVEQVLLGSIVGDGNITKKNNEINSYFRERHGIKQKDYLKWKVFILKKEFKVNILYKKYYYKNINKFLKIISINTNRDKRLNKYHKLAYPTGKGRKVISLKLLNKLTWFGIAVWFIDDGSYKYYYPNGCVQIANKFNIDNIIKFFKTKGFNFKKTTNCVYLNVLDSKRFIKKITPYIKKMSKDVQYKLGNDKEKINKIKLWELEYGLNYYQQIKKK